jgi:hypothetical protein
MDQTIGVDVEVDKVETPHEQRCRQVTDTYCTIEDMLAVNGRKVPAETIADLCSIALRLILVRP